MSGIYVGRISEIPPSRLRRILERSDSIPQAVMTQCASIIEDVRERGDQALIELTAAHDGARLKPENLFVSAGDIAAAHEQIDAPVRDALVRAIRNIRKFHEGQVRGDSRWVEVEPGVWCGERWTPIDSVCLYVPRGRGSFSSVACMLGVPARLAEVPRIMVCTPPGPGGAVDPATLFVCEQLGIGEVCRIGGAQAVAAAALGTPAVEACDKFVGPGNAYVTAARRLLANVFDPGPPAGPSESLVLCDAEADANQAAWNLLIEAEHGENSTAVLVTHSESLAGQVGHAAGSLLERLTPQRRAYATEVLCNRGGILVSDSLEASITFANRFAAEHVALMVRRPWEVHPRIQHAGEVLFGDYPVISLGNYAMGVNAVLPTGGRARSASGVGVDDFLKRTMLGFVQRTGAASLSDVVSTLSREEGFSAHHLAVERWGGPGEVKEVLS